MTEFFPFRTEFIAFGTNPDNSDNLVFFSLDDETYSFKGEVSRHEFNKFAVVLIEKMRKSLKSPSKKEEIKNFTSCDYAIDTQNPDSYFMVQVKNSSKSYCDMAEIRYEKNGTMRNLFRFSLTKTSMNNMLKLLSEYLDTL